MNATIQGATKSKTIWAAVVLGALAGFAPKLPGVCSALALDPVTTQYVGLVFAAVMAGLRAVTKNSLADKAASPAPPVA
jgi:hypothetical protein